jgi:UDP-glucose 4-epimerase
MLEHAFPTPHNPSRVVILGAKGFVGKATDDLLGRRGVATLPLGREQLDLLAEGASEKLAGLLRPDDAVVVISARAPCQDGAMLLENVRMAQAACLALQAKPVAHVVYVSSDAVYRDSKEPLTESSCAEPGSLHGAMHLAREIMLKAVVRAPLAIIRPTLIYGASDPHNGYGPNRFRRLAAAGQEIVLFGEGEERRDHVLIDDVAELIVRALMHRSAGVLNAASGEVHSFRAIAERIVKMSARPVAIRGTPRTGPMPHNGYRPFEVSAIKRSFPDFQPTPLAAGLDLVAKSA